MEQSPRAQAEQEEAVQRNRDTPHRGAPPGRQQTGWPVTRRWFWATLITLLIVSAVLVAVLVRAS